ncbi:hypothetical protein [Gordonia humi]|uniref:DUF4878 domain-containing protein n=1 Tax=Gordonia humi TaxID=686429 RepID=A0A840EVT3_9ACTN|nr:hypothetical protein [Gordonia humi]MBB4134433.1 hypothetical protein [Gordonia humi]
MSAKRTDETTPGDLPDSGSGTRSWRAALPFIIALGAAVVVLIVIGVSHLTRPAEERVSDDAKVQYVVNDVYSARNSLNYELFRDSHCEKDVRAAGFPSAKQFADDNRADRDRDGKLVVPEMNVEVTGDRAAVTVHEHRENTEDRKTTTDLTLTKQGDDWKVCTS